MLVFAFSALVALLDQLFKGWAVRAIPLHGEMELIPGVIGLTRLHNYGAAFGILSGLRWELVGIMLLCILFLVFIMLRYNEGFLGTLGLGAVLGGAVGNFIDRLFLGYVVDMFQLQFVDFAIFNIADIFITMGALAFVVSFIITSANAAKELKAEKAEKAKLAIDDGEEYDEYDRYADENSADIEIAVDNSIGIISGTTDVAEDYSTQSHITPAQYLPHESHEVEYAPEQTYVWEQENEESEVETSTEPPTVFPDVSEEVEESSLLSELDSLEQELSQSDSLSEINIDELLREYGIENDDN
jgi:signal peptidase II